MYVFVVVGVEGSHNLSDEALMKLGKTSKHFHELNLSNFDFNSFPKIPFVSQIILKLKFVFRIGSRLYIIHKPI